MLRYPCILGDPKKGGTKSEVAASPLPSWGPKRGRKCYATPAFSGVPNKGEQNHKGMCRPCLLGNPKEGGNATLPLHCRGSQKKREQNQKWLPQPCLLGAQKRAKMPRHPCILGGPQRQARVAKSEVVPQTKGNKIRSGCLTLAFSGAQKRAEMLRHPCILGGPQRQARGASSEVVTQTEKKQFHKWLPHPCLLEGPKRGRKCCITLALSRIPNKGEQNQKWLPHPFPLGSPKEGGNATSPLHSRGSPTKVNKIRDGGVTLAFSGTQKRAEMLRHPCIVGDPKKRGTKSEGAASPVPFGGAKKGGNATSPLHSRGSPTPTAGSKIRSGPQQRETKSKVAVSPLPSQEPKRGRKCHVIPTFSGIQKKGEQNHKWLPHSCLLGNPKEGGNATPPLHSRGSKKRGNKTRRGCLTRSLRGRKRGRKCYVTPAFSGVPNANRGEQNQKWSPTKGNKIKSGCLTLAFSGTQKRAEMPCYPYILGDPQKRGTKSQVVALFLRSREPKRGRKCYVTPAFSGIQKKGEQNQKGLPHPFPSGAQKRAEMLCHPCILGGPQRQPRGAKSEVVPNKGKQNQKRLSHPCLLGNPKEGGNATLPLHSRGSKKKGNKITSGCLIPAFLETQKRAEMLRHPCIPGDPTKWGTKPEGAASPLPSREPKGGRKCYVILHSRGSPTPTAGSKIRSGYLTPAFSGTEEKRKCYITPTFSGIPKKRQRNQKWVPHPCRLGGPKQGGKATTHLHSRGSPTKVNKITRGCGTLAFSGAQKRAKMLCHPCILGGSTTPSAGSKFRSGPQTKGNKIRSGCLTPAFSRAQKRAGMLHHPCIVADPKKRGHKIRSGCLNLAFLWPKRGRKCHVLLVR